MLKKKSPLPLQQDKKKPSLGKELAQEDPCFSKIALHVSTDMLSGILVGTGLGYAADRGLNTWPWFLILGFVLGSAAGFLNVYRTVKPFLGSKKPKGEK